MHSAFELLVSPGVVGAALVLAGLALVAAPWLVAPDLHSRTFWSKPLTSPDALRVSVMMTALAIGVMIALAWRRYALDIGDTSDHARITEDARVRLVDVQLLESRGWLAPWIGLTLMILGSALGVGSWLALQRGVPATEASIPLGRETEAVGATVGGQAMQLMLPRRITVTRIERGTPGDPEDPARVTARFALPKQDDVPEETIVAGESLDVEGTRFTFVGIREDKRSVRAVLEGIGEQVIEQRVAKGESFRVALDGPIYTLDDLTADYLGRMGPAVQVSSPETGSFWVFQRDTREELGARGVDADLALKRLETSVGAVFTVAPALPFWPIITAGALFVLGLAGLLSAPELVRRRREDDLWSLGSINEAGSLAEGLEDEGEASIRSSREEEE